MKQLMNGSQRRHIILDLWSEETFYKVYFKDQNSTFTLFNLKKMVYMLYVVKFESHV